MRLILPLLGTLAVYAITMTPPEPSAFDDLCKGMTTAVTIASSAIAVRDRHSPNAEIERKRLEFVNALLDISVTFQTGIEKGENFSRTGRKVSKDFIYTLEQLIAGGIRPKHVEDVAELLVKRVTELLDNAKDMHEYFGTVQTELEKLEIKVNKESLHIQNSVARAQYEVEKARKHREETAVVGGLLGILAPIFPPLAIPALISVGMAHDYNLDVQDGKHVLDCLRNFLGDLGGLRQVVEKARDATAVQIQYWSQTLDELGSLDASSRDWLEKTSSEWMAEKLLAQWKVVAQKYSECAHLASEAGRILKAHM